LNFTLFIYGKGTQEGSLDKAIDTQGQYLLDKMPPNSILAIIGISSGSEDLSKYITEGLTSYIMNNNTKNIMIVERTAMPILQQEIDFQYSGAVDDDLMISIGKMVGANTVIAGTIYSIGSDLRFNIRAIEIETTFVIVSNGIDFYADKKLKSLLNGGTVEKILSRDNIPVRQSDGSISRANKELRENQIRTINNAVNFFTEDFPDRKSRWFFGYNYYPEYPLGIETGCLRNGLGFYNTVAFGRGFLGIIDYPFSYIGEILGVLNFGAGITYPLYFNWLWVSGGADFYLNHTVYDYYVHSYNNSVSWQTEMTPGGGLSLGTYISIKRFYFTVKYRYLFNQSKNHNFMCGIGINLNM
jgi:TolB-like protein